MMDRIGYSLPDHLAELVELYVRDRRENHAQHAGKIMGVVRLGHASSGWGPFKQAGVEFSGLALGEPKGPTADGRETYVHPGTGLHIAGKRIDQWELTPRFCEQAMIALLTNTDPNVDQTRAVSERIVSEALVSFWNSDELRTRVQRSIELNATPDANPMNVFAIGMASVAESSRLAGHIRAWRPDHYCPRDRAEDFLDGFGIAIGIAAEVYCRMFKGDCAKPPKAGESIAETFVTMVDMAKDESQRELQVLFIDLAIVLMTWHGPFNASTLAGLVASGTGADTIQSWIAMLMALAGHNHGGASPWAGDRVFDVVEQVGLDASPEAIREAAERHLNDLGAIVACGHRILREFDARKLKFEQFIELISVQLPAEERKFLAVIQRYYDEACDLLKAQGKARFPEPNVDALTIALAHTVGLAPSREFIGFGYVLFGLARMVGSFKANFWAAADKLVLIRPGALKPDATKALLAQADSFSAKLLRDFLVGGGELTPRRLAEMLRESEAFDDAELDSLGHALLAKH